jgi:hypothetical protein
LPSDRATIRRPTARGNSLDLAVPCQNVFRNTNQIAALRIIVRGSPVTRVRTVGLQFTASLGISRKTAHTYDLGRFLSSPPRLGRAALKLNRGEKFREV